MDAGFVVVACGGGGIPIIEQDGHAVGVEAVIDKDLGGQRLATLIGANIFVILTDVDGAYTNYGTPKQELIKEATSGLLKNYLRDGQFKEGSMAPKVEAAIRFVEAGGEQRSNRSPRKPNRSRRRKDWNPSRHAKSLIQITARKKSEQVTNMVSFVGKWKGKHFLDTDDFSQEQIKEVLDAADVLRKLFRSRKEHHYLPGKTLFMMFYNRSLRTRNSFEAGMYQLGGHAHFLSPQDVYTPALPEDMIAYQTEAISDVSRVLSRYGDAIAIRIYGDAAKWNIGRGHKVVREFAKYATIPVLNMEDDMYHPFQALADCAGYEKCYSKIERKETRRLLCLLWRAEATCCPPKRGSDWNATRNGRCSRAPTRIRTGRRCS